MPKYTQEVKDKCVAAVKEGKSFAEIKATLGPNPKAVQRYLVKAGVDWKELKEELTKNGKLKPNLNINKTQKAKNAKDAANAKKAVEPTEEIIEE